MREKGSIMITVTKKSRAMMAARILGDVAGAAIINSSLIRSSIESGLVLEKWIADSEPTNEVFTSGTFILRMLEKIEAHARGMESVVIEEDLINQVWGVRIHISGLLRQKQVERNKIRRRKRKLKEEKKQHLEEDPITKPSALFSPENSDKSDEDEKLNVPKATPEPLPTDLRRCHTKASWCSLLLWFLLTLILIIGALSITSIFSEVREELRAEMQRNVTIELGQVAQEALKELGTVLTDPVASTADAISLLAGMASASKSYGHEMYFDGDNYLTEYRVARQDFSQQNLVTSVLSPRLFGGICQLDKTMNFFPENDAYAHQQVVFQVLTPHNCDNDAVNSGIFADVTPSFLRFTVDNFNYRRRKCSVAAFYSNAFEFSVSVTRDHETLQNTVIPKDSLFGRNSEIKSRRESTISGFTLWIALCIVIASCVVFLLITWMSYSRLPCRGIFFPVLIGCVVFVALVIATVLSQLIEDVFIEDTLLMNLISVVESITAALLSPALLDNGLALQLTQTLCNSVFKGRLAWTNPTGSSYYPPEMTSLMEIIDAASIASFRRGQYGVVKSGYAVSAVYVESVNLNLFLIQKIEPSKHLAKGILVALGIGVFAGLLPCFFMHFTFLARLRRFAVGLPVLQYYVNGEQVRYFLYVLIFVINFIAIILINMYFSSRLHTAVAEAAEMSLVLVSACLCAGSVGDVCMDGCGMPDFIAMLYFYGTLDQNGETLEIEVIGNDSPLPFPVEADWESKYLGAELTMSGIRTTLLNAPSFATPVVNETWNGVNPRFVIRNMLSTSILNLTHGFSIERFPESFSTSKYSFEAYSIGFTIFTLISIFLMTFLEWMYLHLHVAFKKNKNIRSQYLVITLVILLLPMCGFLLHGFIMRGLLKRAFETVLQREVQLIIHAVQTRLSLAVSAGGLNINQDVLVSFLSAAIAEISNNAMRDGTRYLRFRLGREFPKRGSGAVQIVGMGSDTMVLGTLDSGSSFPECNVRDDLKFSLYTQGNMFFCYQEIPQGSEDVLNTPRLFVIALVSYDEWVTDEVVKLWLVSFRVGMMIATTAVVTLLVATFIMVEVARRSEFPLWPRNQEMVFNDPVPIGFTIENFVPRSHQMLWMLFLIFIGGIVVYFTITIGIFVEDLEEVREVWLSAQTQSEALFSLQREVEYNSYNFLIYPFGESTYDNLKDLLPTGSNSLSYAFLTSAGKKNFETGVQNIYDSLSTASRALGETLLSAKSGAGSVASVISKRYQDIFIKYQHDVLSHLDDFQDQLLVGVTSYSLDGDYSAIINMLMSILNLQEYMKKLFILDHMFINSLATLTPSNPSFWPFAEEDLQTQEVIIRRVAQPAAAHLTATIRAIIQQLTSSIDSISGDSSTAKTAMNLVSTIFSLSVAMNLLSNSMWTLQNERQMVLYAIFLADNSKQIKEEKDSLREIIKSQAEYFTLSEHAELSYRKTQQLIEDIDRGISPSYLFTALPWQRVMTINASRSMTTTAFIVTILCFVGGTVSALVFLFLLKERTIMTYREWYEALQDSFLVYGEEARGEASSAEITKKVDKEMELNLKKDGNASEEEGVPKEDKEERTPWKFDDALLQQGGANGVRGNAEHTHHPHRRHHYQQQQYHTHPRRNKSVQKERRSESPGNEANTLIIEKHSTETGGEGVARQQWSSFLEEGIKQGERRSSDDKHKYRSRKRYLLIFFSSFWWVTLVPLCFIFMLAILLAQDAQQGQPEIGMLLTVHASVARLLERENTLLLTLSMYYAGAIPLSSVTDALTEYSQMATQMYNSFLWAKQTDYSVVVLQVQQALKEVNDIIQDELNTFSATSPFDEAYYIQQSEYSRYALPKLTSEDGYGSLLPVSVTTEGSAVQAFIKDAYETAVETLQANTSSSAFIETLNNFQSICYTLSSASLAELRMWDTVLAGGSINGVKDALIYSKFEQLVGRNALTVIETSEERSAEAAYQEITTYYKKLLDETGTEEQITKLFTETFTPPSLSTPPVSTDAYFAAAYTASYLSSFSTEAVFVSDFAYNRNLISQSLTLQGKESLVNAIAVARKQILNVLQSVSSSSLIDMQPAQRNSWIWAEEYYLDDTSSFSGSTRRHMKKALVWCLVATFWGLVVEMALSYYLFFLRIS